MLIAKTVQLALEKGIIKSKSYYCGCHAYKIKIQSFVIPTVNMLNFRELIISKKK